MSLLSDLRELEAKVDSVGFAKKAWDDVFEVWLKQARDTIDGKANPCVPDAIATVGEGAKAIASVALVVVECLGILWGRDD